MCKAEVNLLTQPLSESELNEIQHRSSFCLTLPLRSRRGCSSDVQIFAMHSLMFCFLSPVNICFRHICVLIPGKHCSRRIILASGNDLICAVLPPRAPFASLSLTSSSLCICKEGDLSSQLFQFSLFFVFIFEIGPSVLCRRKGLRRKADMHAFTKYFL